MQIAVFGTGQVGRTLATALAAAGHDVCMGSRTKDNPKAAEWVAATGGTASQDDYAGAASRAGLVLNCTPGNVALEVMNMAGKTPMRGKIVADLSNPLDFSHGFPPRLTVCNNDSLAEQLQRALPETLFVKVWNTMWCGLMVNPGLLQGERHTVFCCGNDSGAKEEVRRSLLEPLGWKAEDILDLGDIKAARGLEMYLPLWLQIYGALGHGEFNIRVVNGRAAQRA
jgi:predicted dinucleotide-binding enzyme